MAWNKNTYHKSDADCQMLLDWISEGEHQQLDFKMEIDDARKIARSMAAFANADGGRLLIGVKDNGVIAGVHSEEELYMLQAAAEYYAKPQIPYTIKLWNVHKKTVIEAFIAKSARLPHYVQNEKGEWKVYFRVGDQNLVLEPIAVHLLKSKKINKPVFIKYGRDEYKIVSLLKETEKTTAQELCRQSLLPFQIIKNVLTDLVLLNIVDEHVTITGTFFSLNGNINADDYLNHTDLLTR